MQTAVNKFMPEPPPTPLRPRHYADFDCAVTLRDAASILAMSADNIRRLGRLGKIQILKLSARRFVIRQSEISRFLNEAEPVRKRA